VADLGRGPGGSIPPPLFWGKKEEITERRKAGRARETTPCEITLRIPRNS